MRVIIAQLRFSNGTQEFDVGTAHTFERGEFGACADDLQRQFQPVECFNNDVDSLIGNQSGNNQEILLRGRIARIGIHINGRINDRYRLSAIGPLKLRSRVFGNRYQVVRVLAGAEIHTAELPENGAHASSPEIAPTQTGSVLFVLPHGTKGRITVTDMRSAGPGP